MIHVIAACFCAGQNWYVGRRVHSSGMCLGCTRNMAASRALVHLHITGPSLHLVILCCRVLVSPHREHVIVGTWLIAAKSSCVCMMSERPAVCKVFHTLCQDISGYLWMIRIFLVSATSVSIVSNTL
jgi:hypothetical protein